MNILSKTLIICFLGCVILTSTCRASTDPCDRSMAASIEALQGSVEDRLKNIVEKGNKQVPISAEDMTCMGDIWSKVSLPSLSNLTSKFSISGIMGSIGGAISGAVNGAVSGAAAAAKSAACGALQAASDAANGALNDLVDMASEMAGDYLTAQTEAATSGLTANLELLEGLSSQSGIENQAEELVEPAYRQATQDYQALLYD